MKGSHQRGQSGNLCSIPDGFKGQLTLESQINGKIRGSKVLREKTVRAENLGNTSCDLLLALQRDHIPLAWGDWSGIQDQVGAACSISSQPQISSCYLRNWKACKKKHKTDLFLMNTSQNLTLPPSFRVKPNTILVWGVDGQADGASVFPNLSRFFWFPFPCFTQNDLSSLCSHPQTFELKIDFSLSWSWVLDAPERIFWGMAFSYIGE